MRTILVTPAPAGSRHGNRTTAQRWAGILRDLGHRVDIVQRWTGAQCDLLVALHARRSYDSIRRFHRAHPDQPLIVALTGTDLYGDLRPGGPARRSLGMATRLVTLQPLALQRLPTGARAKARVIHQSAPVSRGLVPKSKRTFDVCVLAHLRAVKDPFRAAVASRRLPSTSRIRILQVGAAMSRSMASRARAEEERNPRYRWLEDLPRGRALRALAGSRILVLSSRVEGGANAVSEALATGVPIVASRIPGNVGLLGKTYPGYFPVANARRLAQLLLRAETDRGFLADLTAHCRRRARVTDPAREVAAWRSLLRELGRR